MEMEIFQENIFLFLFVHCKGSALYCANLFDQKEVSDLDLNPPLVLRFESDVPKVNTRNTILELQINRNLERRRLSHCPGIRDDIHSNREQIYISAYNSIKSTLSLSLEACPNILSTINFKLSRAICCRMSSLDVNNSKAVSINLRSDFSGATASTTKPCFLRP
ncbi:hypothetical protein CEXT_296381 [Caerostris extrusa]|uniref:Uncharacterized protein n=1 Tax=Caerostris extrusa TaxID=172846 RepID=A0AAV4U9W4_CAEEX|nr:hypothetical protein CEXT_296381 [Caerostris extrusa]